MILITAKGRELKDQLEVLWEREAETLAYGTNEQHKRMLFALAEAMPALDIDEQNLFDDYFVITADLTTRGVTLSIQRQ